MLPSYLIRDYHIRVVKTLAQLYMFRTSHFKRVQVILVVTEGCRTCKDMLYKLINKKIKYKSKFDIVLYYYNPKILEFRKFQKLLGLRAVPDIIVRKPRHRIKNLFKVYRKK